QLSIASWKPSQIEELMEVLDRSEYLAQRTQINEAPKTDVRLKDAKLQKLRFEFVAGRQSKLHDFLIRLNPKLQNVDRQKASQSAFVALLQYPAHRLGPRD